MYFSRIFLASCLILNSPLSVAKFSAETETQYPGTEALLKPLVIEPLTPSYKEIAKRKMREHLEAPARIKALLKTKVRAYFPNLKKDEALPNAEVERLISDAKELSDYMKSNDRSGQFDLFAEQNLEPYIRDLKPADVVPAAVMPVAGKKIGIGNWTLESVVVSRMLNFMSKGKNFGVGALKLAQGVGLKGASRIAMGIATLSAVHYFYPAATPYASMFMLMTFWDSFKAGPLGTILNSGSGWFVRPTSEFFTVLESRYTAQAEIRLNRAYDKVSPKSKPGETLTEKQKDMNDRVRLTTMETDGMDFGGMTHEDQLENWEQGLGFMVTVAKSFGQLLRGTYHAGRDLMMLSWTDQQNVTQLVELMDLKRIALRTESNAVLAPFKTTFLLRDQPEKKVELEEAFEEFELQCSRVWQEPDMSMEEVDKLALEIGGKVDRLKALGLSKIDINLLIDIQKTLSRAIATKIATLAIGEVRGFYGAERNRNLVIGPRQIDQAVRNGLGTEIHREENLPLVQRQMRAMKQKISGRTTAVKLPSTRCEAALRSN